MSTWKPSALETAMRKRALEALYERGYRYESALGVLRQALKDAPRGQRASTTFRKVAERAEASVAAGLPKVNR